MPFLLFPVLSHPKTKTHKKLHCFLWLLLLLIGKKLKNKKLHCFLWLYFAYRKQTKKGYLKLNDMKPISKQFSGVIQQIQYLEILDGMERLEWPYPLFYQVWKGLDAKLHWLPNHIPQWMPFFTHQQLFRRNLKASRSQRQKAERNAFLFTFSWPKWSIMPMRSPTTWKTV